MSFKNDLLVCMHTSCEPVCAMSMGTCGVRGWHQIPWSWNYRCLWTAQCEFWDPNSDPLAGQQQVLLTVEPLFWTPNETLWIWSHGKNESPSNVDVFNACKEWVVFWWAFIIIISITLISLHTTRQCHWERGEMTGCRKERGTIYLPSLLEAATVTGVYGWMGPENHHSEVWERSPQGNMGSGETFGSWHCAICLPHLCAFWVSIS